MMMVLSKDMPTQFVFTAPLICDHALSIVPRVKVVMTNAYSYIELLKLTYQVV